MLTRRQPDKLLRFQAHFYNETIPASKIIQDPPPPLHPRPYLKNLPTILLAILPARFPDPNADPARFDAWLNLSHLENAKLFVIVKTSAITIPKSQHIPPSLPKPIGRCTHQQAATK